MPKSKNRRKPKSNRTSSTGAQSRLEQDVLEAPGGEGADAKAERATQRVAKKKNVGPIQFFRQVRAELQKVTWTSRGETMVSTIMVLIMVALMSLFFFAVDQLLRWVVPMILSLNLF